MYDGMLPIAIGRSNIGDKLNFQQYNVIGGVYERVLMLAIWGLDMPSTMWGTGRTPGHQFLVT